MAATKPLRYERVAEIIERQIDAGMLRPAERAPSLRSMSRQTGFSIGTVVQAYLDLERRGLLESRPRSGFFVATRSAPTLTPPAPRRAISRRPLGVSPEVADVVMETYGRTDLITFDRAVTESVARINGRLNGLTRRVLRHAPNIPNVLVPPPGHAPLRREIASRMALCGMRVSADDVVITNGAQEAIALSLGILCAPGDAVLVETPTYFGILQLLEQLRLKVVEVPNHAGTGIDVDALEYVVSGTRIAAAVLQSGFNNPTGAQTPDEAKERIVELLARNRIPLIEDDVNGDLHLGKERPRLFSAFDGAGDVILCGSITKSVSLGFRLGWAISARHAAALSRAKFCTSVGNPTLQQYVAARYFAERIHERHLRRVRDDLRDNCGRFAETIAKSFPSGTRASTPAGGVVFWVELPNEIDGVALFHRALERGIGIAPGVIFSAKADYRNFIRLSAGVTWSSAVAKALTLLGKLAAG